MREREEIRSSVSLPQLDIYRYEQWIYVCVCVCACVFICDMHVSGSSNGLYKEINRIESMNHAAF